MLISSHGLRRLVLRTLTAFGLGLVVAAGPTLLHARTGAPTPDGPAWTSKDDAQEGDATDGDARSVDGAQADDRPQETAAEPVPVIADEPRTIDPAALVPAPLAVPVTVEFADSSLREVVEWIRTSQGIVVLVEQRALAEAGLGLGDPVTDRSADAPLYLMLDRLASSGLAWRWEDDILRITSTDEASSSSTTESYNIGDLFDAGYEPDSLLSTLMAATGGTWVDYDGEGGDAQLLGDVLFVRHTAEVQRQVQGLLAALREHGRRTLTLDPPQHQALRAALDGNVTVAYVDTPLETVVADLASQSGVDIRLDRAALRELRIREREPVTLALEDRELSTVSRVLLSELGLTWIFRDGVLWFTSESVAESFHKTAVFDVRDLCRDASEAIALVQAIQTQTTGPWEEVAGEGGVARSPRPGTLVVRHQESVLDEIEALLERYRVALRGSKPRTRGENPEEVVTRYYRMHERMAQDLERALPSLVGEGTWQTPQAEGIGTILRLASAPEVTMVSGDSSGVPVEQARIGLIAERSVLVITHRRDVHDQIAELIGKVEHGDGFGGHWGEKGMPADAFDGGMGGMGGGGFGGGYFSMPDMPVEGSRSQR